MYDTDVQIHKIRQDAPKSQNVTNDLVSIDEAARAEEDLYADLFGSAGSLSSLSARDQCASSRLVDITCAVSFPYLS